MGGLLFVRDQKKSNRYQINSGEEKISFCEGNILHYEEMIHKLRKTPVKENDWFLEHCERQVESYREKSADWMEDLKHTKKTFKHRLFGY
ncbi:hypothetical protein ACFL29_01980 [Patescibacteria group bacterium]